MNLTIEKRFTGPSHWAQSYLGTTVRTPHGYGKVDAVQVKRSEGMIVLTVFVADKQCAAELERMAEPLKGKQ